MEFSNATIALGGKTIVEKLDIKVRRGEFVCIVGASGCGKTTALRLAAGLYQPTSGAITFARQLMSRPRRDIAIVFQDYGKALLPWRTAAGNISLALEAAGLPSADREFRIKLLLQNVGLPNHADKYPAEMSGGMQQRLQVKQWFNGTILLSGAISDGWSIASALALGADLAYMGTRFIATEEANADPGYKKALTEYAAHDTVYTNLFTGVHGNYLGPSIAAAGLDPNNLPVADKSKMNFGSGGNSKAKAWRDIWGSGRGIGQITDAPPVAELVERLRVEFAAASSAFLQRARA